MRSEVLDRVPTVRAWLASNVHPETLAFPNEDAAWAFITKQWPTIGPNDAEALLGESMREIPFEEPSLPAPGM